MNSKLLVIATFLVVFAFQYAEMKRMETTEPSSASSSGESGSSREVVIATKYGRQNTYPKPPGFISKFGKDVTYSKGNTGPVAAAGGKPVQPNVVVLLIDTGSMMGKGGSRLSDTDKPPHPPPHYSGK